MAIESNWNVSSRIAAEFGLAPEDVTTEFIHKQRAILYRQPDHRFIDDRGLLVFNQTEFDAEHRIAQAFLDEVLSDE